MTEAAPDAVSTSYARAGWHAASAIPAAGGRIKKL